ncbi:MAG: slipin family protein [Candidatus Cloacimonadota bacterium]|nr:slipin family protein [Candidatus Cloacimonadota bacterium]
MVNLVSIIIVLAVIILFKAIRIVKEYERGVVFRLGRLLRAKGPGLFLLIPFIDKMVKVQLRTVTMDVPPQDIITRDNVPVKVNAVIYFRVIDPEDAIVKVENYILATSQIAQTSLRNILGKSDLDDLLTHREKISSELQSVIDELTDPWGVKVSVVEVKDVELPSTMQRAMAKQAEAERERRAKIIHAEGEFQASKKLSQAADILSKNTASIQLRFLQTLTEISAEKNSTIVFPLPIDIMQGFLNKEKIPSTLAETVSKMIENYSKKE